MSAYSLPHKVTPLPCRDSITANQISTLLQVAGCLGAFVANTRTDDGGVPVGGANDGGARMAAEVTFAKVCSRLDAIVDDPARWDMSHQDTLEKRLMQMYDENIECMKLAQQQAKSLLSPSTRFRPGLIFLSKLGWCAILGDMNHLEHCVIGYGATPEQAMLAFDVNFEAGPPDAAVILAAAREKALMAGKPAPAAMILPIKKKTKRSK